MQFQREPQQERPHNNDKYIYTLMKRQPIDIDFMSQYFKQNEERIREIELKNKLTVDMKEIVRVYPRYKQLVVELEGADKFDNRFNTLVRQTQYYCNICFMGEFELFYGGMQFNLKPYHKNFEIGLKMGNFTCSRCCDVLGLIKIFKLLTILTLKGIPNDLFRTVIRMLF